MRFAPPIVAQTNAGRVWGRRVRPVPVGLVPWSPEDDRTTIVVKASFDVGERFVLSERQRPFGRGAPATRSGALDIERAEVDDLVAVKLGADVLFAGSAYAARPCERIACRIRIEGTLDLSFLARAPTAVDRISLVGAHVRSVDGERPIPPVGPIRARAVEARVDGEDEVPLDEETRQAVLASIARDLARLDAEPPAPRAEATASDVSAEPSWDDVAEARAVKEVGVQHAAAHLVVPSLRGDEVLELEGLLLGGEPRRLALPNLEPVVLAVGRLGRHRVTMECDTLVLDEEGLTMTWRGQVPEDLLATPIARLSMTLAERGQWPSLVEIEHELARAHHERIMVADASPAPLPVPSPDVELELAPRMSAHAVPHPLLTAQEFDLVRRDLEATDDRALALVRHGLDEEEWALALRAHARWTEKVR